MKEYPNEYADFLYYSPAEEEKAIGIWPLRSGKMIAKPNYQSGPRYIHYYNVHFVLEGQLIFYHRDEQITLGKGDVFCLFPNQPVLYKIAPSSPNLQMTWIAFDGERAGALLEYAGLTEEKPFLRKEDLPELSDRFQELLYEFRRLLAGGESLKVISSIYDLFSVMAAARKRRSSDKDRLTWIQESQNFMHMHYAENINVADVAQYVGLHRTHFSAMFSQKTGLSPMQYLQRLRMRNGAELIRDTDLSITEIALSLNYPDLYSFTRAFRKYYGLSPTQYRKNRQEEHL